MTALSHSPSRPLCKTDGQPKGKSTACKSARAAVVAVLSGTGIARRKFKNGQTAVRINLWPWGEVGSS